MEAYSKGEFPMAISRDVDGVDWYLPRWRGIIPIDRFHISKNVRRIIRQRKFEVRIDTQFREVVRACADRETTWINDMILNSYDILNQAGFAHSVEVYRGQDLVGGLYGVHLQSAFFGESMFKNVPEADKIALYYCHQILQQNGFILWDTQFYTDHLSRFGCIEIEANEYSILLKKALQISRTFGHSFT